MILVDKFASTCLWIVACERTSNGGRIEPNGCFRLIHSTEIEVLGYQSQRNRSIVNLREVYGGSGLVEMNRIALRKQLRHKGTVSPLSLKFKLLVTNLTNFIGFLITHIQREQNMIKENW